MNELEAIRILKEAKDSTQEEYDEAFSMAIKSLEMQDRFKQLIRSYENTVNEVGKGGAK